MNASKTFIMTFEKLFGNSIAWTLADIYNDLSKTCSAGVGFSLTIFSYGAGCILIMFGLNRIIRKIMGRYTTRIEETKIKEKIAVRLHRTIGRSYNNEVETNKCLNYIYTYPEVINFRLRNGYTPFLKACISGCKEIVLEMLIKGADINTSTVKGDGPLFLAVFAVITKKINDFSILNVLINAGCSVNQTKNSGYSALHLAARSGDQQLVRWLLLNGADPNPRTSTVTPFILAKKNGHDETAALLFINLGPESNEY